MAGSISSSYADEDDGAMSAINVTPLVDVTLVLLIVFMITVPAIVGSARVKVDVPETTSVEAETEQIAAGVRLEAREVGQARLYLNENQIDEAGVRKMFEGSKLNKDQRFRCRPIKEFAYGEVMKVIDLLESLGLRKLALDTRHVEAADSRPCLRRSMIRTA